MIDYFIFALVGRILLYFIQEFPLTSFLSKKWEFLRKLFSCDLCLGVWVYFFIAFPFKINLFDWYFVGLSELIVAAVTSFLVHLAKLGWDSKFREIRIE